MSLATYAGLKTLVSDYLGNTLAADSYDDFVTLFEARLCRLLHIRENTTTASITMTSGTGPLPSDFIAAKRVTWTGDPNRELEYVHPTYLRALYPTTGQGTPSHYTIEGGNILVRPVDDTALSILYVERTDALSGTLNSIFTKHPDVYLFGTLVEAESFLANDERVPMWKSRLDEALAEIMRQDFNYRSPMQIRVLGATP